MQPVQPERHVALVRGRWPPGTGAVRMPRAACSRRVSTRQAAAAAAVPQLAARHRREGPRAVYLHETGPGLGVERGRGESPDYRPPTMYPTTRAKPASACNTSTASAAQILSDLGLHTIRLLPTIAQDRSARRLRDRDRGSGAVGDSRPAGGPTSPGESDASHSCYGRLGSPMGLELGADSAKFVSIPKGLSWRNPCSGCGPEPAQCGLCLTESVTRWQGSEVATIYIKGEVNDRYSFSRRLFRPPRRSSSGGARLIARTNCDIRSPPTGCESWWPRAS